MPAPVSALWTSRLNPLLLTILVVLCGNAYAAGWEGATAAECDLARAYIPITQVINTDAPWQAYAVWGRTNHIYLNERHLYWHDDSLEQPLDHSIWASCVFIHEAWHIQLRRGDSAHHWIHQRTLDCLHRLNAPQYQINKVQGWLAACRPDLPC